MFPHHSPCGKTSRHLRFNRFFLALPIPKQPFLHSLELNQAALYGRETRSLQGNRQLEMLLPREGRLGAFLDAQSVSRAAPVTQTPEGAPGFSQFCLCHSCHHHSPCTELDLPQQVPWEGKADPSARQQPGDQCTFPPVPPRRACRTQDYLILCCSTGS